MELSGNTHAANSIWQTILLLKLCYEVCIVRHKQKCGEFHVYDVGEQLQKYNSEKVAHFSNIKNILNTEKTWCKFFQNFFNEILDSSAKNI